MLLPDMSSEQYKVLVVSVPSFVNQNDVSLLLQSWMKTHKHCVLRKRRTYPGGGLPYERYGDTRRLA